MSIESELPEYRDALEHERRTRGAVFLGLPYDVCGIPLRQMTPRILALLSHCNNPFVEGGNEIGMEDVYEFVWICSVEYQPDGEAMADFIRRHRGMDWMRCGEEILDFIDVTFFDSNTGGKPGTAYVSGIASILYRMHKLFGWDTERTMDEPLRLIYQLLRCRAIEDGAALVNPISDKVLSDQLAKLQTATPEEVADLQKRWGNN